VLEHVENANGIYKKDDLQHATFVKIIIKMFLEFTLESQLPQNTVIISLNYINRPVAGVRIPSKVQKPAGMRSVRVSGD